MTINEFIAEIESDFSIYAETGDIDRVTIKRIVLNELKAFGNNILTDQEAVVDISNSRGKLPENFRSLWLAMKCDPYAVEYKDEDRDTLQQSYYWKKRIESDCYWDENLKDYRKGCDKIITEEVYYHDAHIKFHYKNPTFLTLTKGFNKSLCTKDCVNTRPGIRNTSPHEIGITNGYVNTNFSEGTIYIQYKGFEQDENGDVVIPETWNGKLIKYLEWYIKYRITINLLEKNVKPDSLKPLLELYRQESESARAQALTESKFNKINKGTFEVLKNRNKIQTLKVERSFPIL